MASNKLDVVVIGIGRFGASVVEHLVESGRYVLAIDSDQSKLESISRIAHTVAEVDGSDEVGLKALSVSKYNTAIVASSNNIEIVATLLELGVKHIIAKAISKSQERVLRQIGVNVIVRPEYEAGARTAIIATNSNFINFSESLKEVGDGFVIGSTKIKNIDWIGQNLQYLPFDNFGVRVVSIKRNATVTLPTGQLVLKENDLITIIGKISKVTKMFGELNTDVHGVNHTKTIKMQK